MARHELALGVVVLLLLVDPTLAQPSVGPPPPPGPVTTKPPPSAPPAGPVTGMPPATPGGRTTNRKRLVCSRKAQEMGLYGYRRWTYIKRCEGS